ncbi:membrane-bound alkaline phosphatase-like [Anticarsia gemmatalis]|uniref:membrane-bound alkaline phosphatase-like n=1 Tax=Anticarsia gemmatalis TaxID=129554 RepID=UPI003F768F2A
MWRHVSTTLALLLLALARPSHERDIDHSRMVRGGNGPSAEASPQYWATQARAAIDAKLHRKESTNAARNVVMFLGDGMSVTTLAAARTLMGQRRGNTGEESQLSFEAFPSTGFSKTYCVDAQIADSACSATAYLGGSKANIGTIGVSAAVQQGDCVSATDPANHVHSIADWALKDGRSAGIVTTTRVTHASPAGVYAHTGSRHWESDFLLTYMCGTDEPRQSDIALQLIENHPGDKFQVILGGGRREFLPNTVIDEEGTQGQRLDGRNLIEEWQEAKKSQNVSYQYVWNREQLMEASEELPEYLLGLFEGGHMQYHMEADPTTEPTLAELTEVAIRSLSRNEKGFFLFVEGGRIDHAHHDNLARLALDETIQLSEAVARAAELLSEDDSLLVVTSDHAHVMTLNGYSPRGSDILGPSLDGADMSDVPYMTLSYANGPGFRQHADAGVRTDVSQQDYRDTSFLYEAMVPLYQETHGGEDVAVFARGPHHSLFSGVYEQSQIPHLMAYVGCFGDGPHACDAHN